MKLKKKLTFKYRFLNLKFHFDLNFKIKTLKTFKTLEIENLRKLQKFIQNV
jgi:hypothetical protein